MNPNALPGNNLLPFLKNEIDFMVSISPIIKLVTIC